MTLPDGRWTRRRFLGVTAALPLLAAACGSSEASSTADGAGPERKAYGPGDSQFGDLWLPNGEGPFPVLVLVHGGFWRAEYDLSLMDDLAADARDRRWAVWNIEYRRVGEDGGGWPGTFDDVAAAVDHLAPLAADGVPVDMARVAVAGHSAGGHLAAWIADRPGLPSDAPGAAPEVRPIAVVSQAGVLDLRRAAADGVGGTATQDLLGGEPAAVGERYDLASPIERLPSGVPVRCVHGRQDGNVPFSQSQRFVAAAEDAGDDVVLAPFDGDHFTVLDPSLAPWKDTVAWLRPRLQP
ncbi:prolyl oligopeptidase family serine peptidase [Aquihabitans sp. G128]|uniref:alpha/beta hydrolase family protein n=1 Tax=Aquihabitans sp. G128 TaxID=2849779 RepID=UPI001C2416F8|nr:prolyl oligopeptidase family serine peptidase [Aquihabitans sp. G128]QXC63216.1 prolyl oligopeptidase family serine peptidase [Aquihabitans sp. G128]